MRPVSLVKQVHWRPALALLEAVVNLRPWPISVQAVAVAAAAAGTIQPILWPSRVQSLDRGLCGLWWVEAAWRTCVARWIWC
jgi:hypothetical protein